MKKNILIFILLASVLVVGSYYAGWLHSKVKYVEEDCIFCGSREVLDFGEDNDGSHFAYCHDCSARFMTTN
jgi:hypothetical protein